MASSRAVNRVAAALVAAVGLVTAGFSAAGGTPPTPALLGTSPYVAPVDVYAPAVVLAPLAPPAVLAPAAVPALRLLPLPRPRAGAVPMPSRAIGPTLGRVAWQRPSMVFGPFLASLMRFMTPRVLTHEEAAEVAIARTFPNGQIPASYLCSVGPDLLRCDAARSFLALDTAFRMRFGRSIALTDGYRSLNDQFWVKRHWLAAGRGFMAASPGTSNHGLGLAVDLAGPEAQAGTAEHTWLAQHAPGFGWEWPMWARQQPKFEPWHFEFMTSDTNRPDPAVPLPWMPTPRPPFTPPPSAPAPVKVPVVRVPVVSVTTPVSPPVTPTVSVPPTETLTVSPSFPATTATTVTTGLPTVTVSVPSPTSSTTTTVTVTATVIPTTTIPVPTITTTVTTTPTGTGPTTTSPDSTCATLTVTSPGPSEPTLVAGTDPSEVWEPCAVGTLPVDVPPVSPEPPPNAATEVHPTPTVAPLG